MLSPSRISPRRALDEASSAALWFESSPAELSALKPLLGSDRVSGGGGANQIHRVCVTGEGAVRRWSAEQTLLRRVVPLAPQPVRPYFAVCALEGWRRVPVRQLAGWSGIPLNVLKRYLAVNGLTPGGVAAWNFALHATWLLDVAELPARAVVSWMRLGRTAALGALLGARAVPFTAGRVHAGAFSATLKRYLDLLRAAFGA